MGTSIVYQCDVCNRQVQILQNKKGLDTIGSCVITNSCKGRLHPIGKKENVLQIPIATPSVDGLQDWVQRRALFTHTQYTPQFRWTINHQLGAVPAVQAYSDENVEIIPIAIDNKTPFQTEIIFAQKYAGVAQCIARSSSTLTEEDFIIVEPVIGVSRIVVNGELTITTLSSASTVTLHLQFLNPDNLTPLGNPYPVAFTTPVSFLSAWKQYKIAFFHNKISYVRSCNVLDIIAANEIPNNAPFYFVDVVVGDHWVLMAKDPWTNDDKDATRSFSLSKITPDNAALVTYQNSGIMYVSNSIISDIYPPIKKFS